MEDHDVTLPEADMHMVFEALEETANLPPSEAAESHFVDVEGKDR
jgi:hypothetical protein